MEDKIKLLIKEILKQSFVLCDNDNVDVAVSASIINDSAHELNKILDKIEIKIK